MPRTIARRVLRPAVALPLTAAVYVLLSFITAAKSSPLPNEAWFFSPAVNLLHNGHMGTTNLVAQGTWLEGIEQRTYWVPPLHLLAQALWYALTGAGLAQMRALSVAWGVVALLATYRIGVRLTLGRGAALLGVTLLAADFRWVLTGSMGRMDMMCAALGLTGIAAYLELRSRSLTQAALAGHALVAASCLTHPCGVVHGLALVIVTLVLDRQRLNHRMAALAAAPYCAALGGWGLYILPDPQGFLRQFTGNISGLAAEAGRSTRFSGLRHPLDALLSEFHDRYFSQFGSWGGGRFFGGLQMYILGLYVASIAAALLNRRHRITRPGHALAVSAAAVFCVFWLLDGSKSSAYLPHVLPWLLLLAGFGLRRLAAGQTGLVSGLLAVALVGQFAAFSGHARKDNLQSETVAVARFLQAHVRPGEFVNGGAEFGFFTPSTMTLADDPRLGYITGRRPDWIVHSGWYGSWILAARRRDRTFDRYVGQLLDRESREVFHAGRVKVYRTGPRSVPVLH